MIKVKLPSLFSFTRHNEEVPFYIVFLLFESYLTLHVYKGHATKSEPIFYPCLHFYPYSSELTTGPTPAHLPSPSLHCLYVYVGLFNYMNSCLYKWCVSYWWWYKIDCLGIATSLTSHVVWESGTQGWLSLRRGGGQSRASVEIVVRLKEKSILRANLGWAGGWTSVTLTGTVLGWNLRSSSQVATWASAQGPLECSQQAASRGKDGPLQKKPQCAAFVWLNLGRSALFLLP